MKIYRTTLFAIGLIVATTGVIFLMIYLSLLNYGFSFGEFIIYILKSKTFYLLPLGIVLMTISLFCSRFWNRLNKIIEDQRHRAHASKSH